MADGSRKPIKEVKLGDKILATDPTTDKSEAREVTDVRSHASERTLVELTIGSDTCTDTGSVVATDEHSFWVASDKRWSHAIDLKPGHKLATPDNRDATITATRSWSETRRVHNLTIDTDHTYYVAGTQEAAGVLVRNEDESCEEVAGEAIVHLDFSNPDSKHALITVNWNGKSMSTHQFGNRYNPDRNGVDFFDPSNSKDLHPTQRFDVRIPLPNAKRAVQYAWEEIARTDRGEYPRYSLSRQSCVTYCANVLREGGVNGVPRTPGKAQEWFMEKYNGQ
jgi:hypothetical protein